MAKQGRAEQARRVDSGVAEHPAGGARDALLGAQAFFEVGR
jgi:hypothetical protein